MKVSPKVKLISLLKSFVKRDPYGNPCISHTDEIADAIMEMVDKRYGHLLVKDIELSKKVKDD